MLLDAGALQNTFFRNDKLRYLLILIGALISTVHIGSFYYSHEAPKWLVFDLGLSLSIFLLSTHATTERYKLGVFAVLNGLIIVWMLSSLFWAPNTYVGIEWLIRYALASLFSLMLVTMLSKETLTTLFIKVSVFSAFVFCIVLLLERYVFKLPINAGTFTPIGFQNNAGHVFNLWIPVLSYQLLTNIRKPAALLYASMLVFLCTILLEAATRGSIVGLVLGELIVFAILLKQNKKLAIRFLSITFAMILSFALSQCFESLRSEKLMTKINSMSGSIDTASGQRMSMFKNTWHMFLDNPVGVGVNNFEYIHPKYARVGQEDHSPFVNERQILKTPHNYILKAFSETGVVGGICSILLYLFIFFCSAVNAIRGEQVDKWLLVAITAVLFHSFFSGVFLNPTSLFFSTMLFSLVVKRSHINFKHYWQINLKPFAQWQILVVPVLSMMWLSSHLYAFQGHRSLDKDRIEQALELNPGNERAWFDLARIQYLKFRDVEGSIQSLNKFLALYPYHIQGLYLAAKRNIEIKNFTQAKYQVDRLLSIYPNFKKGKILKKRLKTLVIKSQHH